MSAPTDPTGTPKNIAGYRNPLYRRNVLAHKKAVFQASVIAVLLFSALFFLPGLLSERGGMTPTENQSKDFSGQGPAFEDFYTEKDMVYLNLLDTGAGIDFDGIRAVDSDGHAVESSLVEEAKLRIAFQIPAVPVTVTIPDQADHVLKLLISPVE